MVRYKKISVTHISLDDLQELGFELGSDKEDVENTSRIQSDYLISLLTKRQQEVATLLNDGYSRREVAKELDVCLQAIHQIVLRIRKRLKNRADVGDYSSDRYDYSEQLVYILNLLYPDLPPGAIYVNWHKHPVLKDYRRPDIKTIAKYLKRAKNA